MSKETIIKEYSANSEGVTLTLTEKTTLKTGNVNGNTFWVSWDKIGDLLFDNYTGKVEVADRDKLRGKV
jgi:hypothetical protein